MLPGPVRSALAVVLGLAAMAMGVSPALGSSPATAVDATAPVRLAIAVPIVAPQGTTGIITADLLEQYTSPLGVLTRELDAVIDRPVTLGIDPMIIASIRLLGDSAPPSATAWLDRLAAASNQTFALAYDDSDLTLATQAGSSAIPQPLSFGFAVDPTHFAPAAESTASPTPTATATPTNPVKPAFPTMNSLLGWPYSLDDVAWPRDDSAVAADVASLAAGGFTTTILSSTNVAREASAGSAVEVEGEKVAVSDASVSTALRAAARSVTDEEWARSMDSLSAAITAAGRAQPGQALVLGTLDRDVPFTGGRLAQTLTALAADSGVQTVPLSSIIAAAGSPATVVDKPQAADRLGLVARVLAAEQSEQQFASVAKDPAGVTGPRRLKVLALLANQWQTNLDGWPAVADDFLATSDDLVSSVEVVASSGINLLADRATLPISVSNTLDQQVTVFITVRATSGLLAVGSDRVKLVIEPNSQGKGQVPVQAISNGTVGLTISLTSSSGVPVGKSAHTQINVQAGWETPVVIVIAVLVVAMFAFGLVRSILKRRRAAGGVDV